jgi:hypothetical protein
VAPDPKLWCRRRPRHLTHFHHSGCRQSGMGDWPEGRDFFVTPPDLGWDTAVTGSRGRHFEQRGDRRLDAAQATWMGGKEQVAGAEPADLAPASTGATVRRRAARRAGLCWTPFCRRRYAARGLPPRQDQPGENRSQTASNARRSGEGPGSHRAGRQRQPGGRPTMQCRFSGHSRPGSSQTSFWQHLSGARYKAGNKRADRSLLRGYDSLATGSPTHQEVRSCSRWSYSRG